MTKLNGMTMAAALLASTMVGGAAMLLATPANAQSCGASAACPPPPPPPSPPVVTPPPGNPVTVNNNSVTQVGVTTSVATEVNTGDQNVTTGDVRTGDQNVTVEGSTTTYRQVRQAAAAYAPTVIAPTAVGRCHETSGGPSGGISTPFGGISLGGRSRATINEQCEGHVQSIENRADGRLAADSIEAVDAESACLARVDAMDANPIISDATVERARSRCTSTTEPIEEPTALRRMSTRAVEPVTAAVVAMEQDNTPVWQNPTTCPAGYSLKDVSDRAFNGTIEMPNSTGGTTTYRIQNTPVLACGRG
jgi:hypothetical protein